MSVFSLLPSMALLISGTSQGIGLALAKRYVAAGQDVVGCARRLSPLSDDRYTHFQVDVTDPSAVSDMFKNLARSKVSVNTLVHASGLTQNSLAMMTSTQTARSIMDVNFGGVFTVTREATKRMVRRNFGRVIVLSSINVALHNRGSSVYNASKAACENLMKTLTTEFANSDITFNSLSLSIVSESGMAASLTKDAKTEKQMGLDKPALLSIEEVAHAIDFLRHKAASNISGETITFGAP